MPIISFYTTCKEQTGNTTSAISLATYLGITQNKKTLFISTSLNDETIVEAIWGTQKRKRSGLFGPNTSIMSDNGIEGLDRIIRSNKISPDIITDYTKVALTNRLEILLGYKGSDEQYKEIQKQYLQIVNMADKCYDNIIIDIDKKLDIKTQNEILNISDVVVGMTTQKILNIEQLINTISDGVAIKKFNTLITLGRYDEKSKYNIKNITRNVLKQREPVNAIPYNTVLFESMQEGQVIDMFLRFLNLKGKDENTFFLEEIKKLAENIEVKYLELQQMKR